MGHRDETVGQECAQNWKGDSADSPNEALRVARMPEYLFRNELSQVLTIVVQSESEDRAREELARIGLHPSFFQLVDA